MTSDEQVPIIPGVWYVPKEQAVYVDTAKMAEWAGMTVTDHVGEQLILAAVRAVRRSFTHSPVRQYVIRGGK